MVNPYAVLGVTPQASDEEITSAYRTLARKYHPDINPGNKAAEAKMKEINAAYEQIKDIRAGKAPDYESQDQTTHSYRTYTYRNPFDNEQRSYQYYSYRPTGSFFRGGGFSFIVRIIGGLLVLRFILRMASCALSSFTTPFNYQQSSQKQTANVNDTENQDFFVV